jgi:beta-glucosidase
VDAVHGHNNLLGAVLFPHNIALGATRDADLVERIGAAVAIQLKATGVPWNFAPCVAVVQDLRWGRTYESFGENPTLVSELGVAYTWVFKAKAS